MSYSILRISVRSFWIPEGTGLPVKRDTAANTMHTIAFFILCLFIVVLKTTILPGMPGGFLLYDLLIPLVIYFSLYRRLAEGLPVVLLSAVMMDMISGAPAGIYLTTYIWLYLAFRQTWRFLDLSHTYLFPAIVVAGVVFQQIIFWVAASVTAGHMAFSTGTLRIAFFQIVWAVVTAPLLYLLFHKLFAAADRLFSGNINENGQSG